MQTVGPHSARYSHALACQPLSRCTGRFLLLLLAARCWFSCLVAAARYVPSFEATVLQPAQSSPAPLYTAVNDSLGDESKLCSTFGLTGTAAISNGSNEEGRRVFDCFLASNEVDMMEIRLRELESVVDAFVIVESRMTFRGKPKALFVPRLMSRLPASVLAKVVYQVLDGLEGDDAWAREKFQRNALFGAGLSRLHPAIGDVLMVSDCDEIPKPAFVLAMKHCTGLSFPLSMQALHHYYSFGLMSSKIDKVWNKPHATLYKEPFQQSAHQLRASTKLASYANSSWHCSTCFSYIASVHKKISSFSHSEFDLPEHKDPNIIIARVKGGVDLFGRPQMQFARDNSGDMPAYIKQHPTRFSHLISRDTADAGFKDLGLPLDS